jgi:signal transduction histidine kinase
LLQCIINYLSNAVKFTETGGIHLDAEIKDETVEIRVSDTGIGIPEKDLKKLFEAFERLDTHLRVKAGGTGLGLYLTKKLATEILGGEIFVKSRENKGSTFGLRIPIRHISPENPQEVEEEATS